MSFAVSASAYDRFMGRYSVRLAPQFAEFTGVSGGQRVLDVGCGTGRALLLMREVVGAEGRVVGVDAT